MYLILIGCFSFALYILFAGETSASELVTGGVLAVLSTLWVSLIRRASGVLFRFSRGLIGPVLVGVLHIIPAVARTGAVFLRVAMAGRSPGFARLNDFDAGVREHPEDRTRRAVAVLLASLAPDRFVVQVEYRRREVMIHSIVPDPEEADARWLI